MWPKLQGQGRETVWWLKQVSCFRAASESGAFSSSQGPQWLTLGSGRTTLLLTQGQSPSYCPMGISANLEAVRG